MGVFLPNLVSNIFNTPIMLSNRKAHMIVGVMAGKMNVQALVDETTRMDARALQDLAQAGRMEARTAIALRNDKHMLAEQQAVPGAMVEGQNWYGLRPYELTESGIAIIRIYGTLTRTWGVGPASGTTGYDGIWTQILFAQDDPSCRGIWLDIASPGGAVDGLFDLADGVYQMSARFGGKPIHGHASDYAHSAAYALLAACDTSSCPELGSVGSIAAICIVLDVTQLMANEGVTAHIFRSGARKAIGFGGMETMDQQELDKIQEDIDFAGTYFVDRVARYRGLSNSSVSETEGDVYRGDQAKAIGLVDQVFSEPDAWANFERAIAA